MHAADTVVNDPVDIVLAKQELVIRYPFRGTHIVVQTAVPQMTERHHATTGKIMLKLPVGRFDEFGKKRRRYGNIMLDVPAFFRLGCRNVLAQTPHRTGLRQRLGQRRIADDVFLDGILEQLFEPRSGLFFRFALAQFQQDEIRVCPGAGEATGVENAS